MVSGKSKGFQFHYGTIKSFSFMYSSPVIVYFNSTMVRLKVYDFREDSVQLAFQFHYGTIKRLPQDAR